MTVRVGVVGTGLIGSLHARRLANSIAGCELVGVSDRDRARAVATADELGGVEVFADGVGLIASGRVDAVVVATVAEAHVELTLAALDAGKPVLCEKPLALTESEGERILAAEARLGRRLVTVGFMRRFDPGYRELAHTIATGVIGEPLLVHCVHRNAALPPTSRSEMSMTDSMVHEVDALRWLLGEEIVAVEVIAPRRSPHAGEGVADPLLAIFTLRSGVVATVEFFGNSRYGYDVRCEVVGSDGVASLPAPARVFRLVGGRDAADVDQDWQTRFATAYHAELQAWIDGVGAGEVVGADAWDGYLATRVTSAGVEAIQTGRRIDIAQSDRPALYVPRP